MAVPSIVRRVGQALRTNPTTRPRVNVTFWSGLAALWLVIAVAVAASGGSPARPAGAGRSGAPSATATSAATSASPSTTAAADPAPSPPSATARRSTPRPADTTGGVVVNAAGAVLPDPRRTPGARNPAVTQASIGSTICVSGWTSTVRPPSSYTTALKERQLASGYAYRGDLSTADYEEDHLISLEIGGSPTSELNLWPEPYDAPDGARVKDVVENRLHALVCSGQISLATAQHAIATNWWTAYLTYVGSPASPGPTSQPPAPPSPGTNPVVPLSCSASMSNPAPTQNSTTVVVVHTAPGATVTATAHYKSKDTTNQAIASPSGVADVAFDISRATIGYPVVVDVTVSRSGASNSCATSFTPR